jgi:hypothetical protein
MAILFMIAFILVTIMTSYNHIMDWPNVINKNPQTMFAIANSSDIHNDTVEERSVEFIDINTKKKINLTFYSEPITKGECMTLDYYPHIKIAVRMQKYYCYCKKIKLK